MAVRLRGVLERLLLTIFQEESCSDHPQPTVCPIRDRGEGANSLRWIQLVCRGVKSKDTILQKFPNGIDLVFTGHSHMPSLFSTNGMTWIILGGGGAATTDVSPALMQTATVKLTSGKPHQN